jgi:cbb3-type cytochrome oxidase subunit 1
MPAARDQFYLLKFLVTSALFFFIGTVHGVLQVIHPVRAWLDSIGSPYGGPGHMIDPLAHAHINVVGGVVILLMGATYFMLSAISGRPVHSVRMVNHSYWWTTLGVSSFYLTLLVFGVWEGNLLLAGAAARQGEVHHIYSYIIATVSTIMGVGFWVFFANVFLTVREIFKTRHDS